MFLPLFLLGGATRIDRVLRLVLARSIMSVIPVLITIFVLHFEEIYNLYKNVNDYMYDDVWLNVYCDLLSDCH